MFTASVVSTFLVLSIADHFGRKVAAILAVGTVLLPMLGVICIDDFTLRLIFSGIAQGSEVSFASLFNLIINECTRN